MAKRLIEFLDCLIWPIIGIYGITSAASTAMSLFCFRNHRSYSQANGALFCRVLVVLLEQEIFGDFQE